MDSPKMVEFKPGMWRQDLRKGNPRRRRSDFWRQVLVAVLSGIIVAAVSVPLTLVLTDAAQAAKEKYWHEWSQGANRAVLQLHEQLRSPRS